jgi:formamidopyrimidine-DNA glycosylase
MPELPEVESVRLGLEKHLIGGKILSFQQLHPRALSTLSLAPLGHLQDLTISALRRRGKFLWFEFTQQRSSLDITLVSHLGMSGQFRIVKLPNASSRNSSRNSSRKNSEAEDLEFFKSLNYKHARAVARISNKNGRSLLIFNDQRTFGWLRVDQLVDGYPASINHIAPDLFDPDFHEAEFMKKISKRTSEVKKALLDQGLISGIGNIYADESLWRAKIHPTQPCSQLTSSQLRRLLHAVREVLEKAVVAGGTSFDNLYVNVNGESGYFENSLQVYGRENEECARCATLITRIKFTNRSSHLCPRCQRYEKA